MAYYFSNLPEQSTYYLKFQLKDNNRDNLDLSSVGTILCTQIYYNENIGDQDRNHLATINNRHNQNVKNANNVTITTTGYLTWELQKEDTAMLSSMNTELHLAIFVIKYGGRQSVLQFQFEIERIPGLHV